MRSPWVAQPQRVHALQVGKHWPVLMNWQERPNRKNLCRFGGHQILLDSILYMDSREAVDTVTPSYG